MIDAFATIGYLYVVLAVCAFTLAACKILWDALRQANRDLMRGQAENLRDIVAECERKELGRMAGK